MLLNIKQFFDRHVLSTGTEPGTNPQRALQVATAALLIEAMQADGTLKEAEHRAVTTAVQSQFQLAVDETESLLGLAQAASKKATDDYRFTALINEHFTPKQKEQVVEYLWRVVAADHKIDNLERTFVNKIADLLYVSRVAQIAARERAMHAALQGTK